LKLSKSTSTAYQLIEKGIITEEEFYAKLKEVQGEYERSKG
jgi:hypothetical protein